VQLNLDLDFCCVQTSKFGLSESFSEIT